MSLFKRDWTAVEAEEWTVHDVWVSVFSILAYLFTAVGVAGLLLFQAWGLAATVAAVACAALTLRIADPKLRAISEEFEQKEAHYLERLDRTTRWEAPDGR